ncbi:cation diffusion facilitator transporter family protein [Acanthocheilonema viteae]
MSNATSNLMENSYGIPNYGSVTDLVEEFHCHSDENVQPTTDRRAIRTLWTSAIICLIFIISELIGGYLAHSLAIITDAAHLLTDFAGMLISLFALYMSKRPASQRMSFGWHRAEVMGAFISVFMIWIITGILVYMAIDRITRDSYHIDASIMAITAALGVFVNFIMAILLYFGGHTHSHNGHMHLSHCTNSGNTANINVRAAMIHVIGDLLQSIGVLIAAMLIFFNKSWSIADPICTLFFSITVLCTTIYIIRDAMFVLLEGSPSSINFRTVFDSLERINGVEKVHNLRIWSLTLDKIAISVHLEITPGANAQWILKQTTQMLRDKYNVLESTVQIEGYDPEKQDCNKCIPPAL